MHAGVIWIITGCKDGFNGFEWAFAVALETNAET